VWIQGAQASTGDRVTEAGVPQAGEAQAEKPSERSLLEAKIRQSSNQIDRWNYPKLISLVMQEGGVEQVEQVHKKYIFTSLPSDRLYLKTQLADLYCQERKFDAGESLYKEIVEDAKGCTARDIASAYENLGEFYLKQLRYPEASKAYEKAATFYSFGNDFSKETAMKWKLLDFDGRRNDYLSVLMKAPGLWLEKLWSALSTMVYTGGFMYEALLSCFLAPALPLVRKVCPGKSKRWCFLSSLIVFPFSLAFGFSLISLSYVNRIPEINTPLTVELLFFLLCPPIVEVLAFCYVQQIKPRFQSFLEFFCFHVIVLLTICGLPFVLSPALQLLWILKSIWGN
jgi:tetratricopeptide (TPR) repeat protein